MVLRRKPRPHLRTAVIAGAFCIVEGKRIIRAAAPNGHDFWKAGRGSWSRKQPAETRAWPAHYAGSGAASQASA